MSVNQFWSQEGLKQINQLLLRLMGKKRFVVEEGKIIGVADAPVGKKNARSNAQSFQCPNDLQSGNIPIEGTNPTVYFVPETKNEADLTIAGSGNPIPDSKIGSGKVTLRRQKAGAAGRLQRRIGGRLRLCRC